FAGSGLSATPAEIEVPCDAKGVAVGRRAGCGPAELGSQRAPDVASEEPIVSGMAGRYALALFELARDTNALDATRSDLDRVEGMIAESPDLTRLVRSPVFGADDQPKGLSAVLAKAQIRDVAT